ncbi:hypothetical protein [Nocardia carnea]|uniref:hypothetical protein n=1 Tax=Nocardia carnea TaxID=37328 RepID=UPI002455A239|nr:hypothetical protein [Nocardia carnea]
MTARITKLFAASTIALALGVIAAPAASAQPVIPGLGSVEICVPVGSAEVCI